MGRNDPPPSDMSFDRLVVAIQQVHVEMAVRASRAVNKGLTLRNRFIGCYIAEYEHRRAAVSPRCGSFALGLTAKQPT